MKKKQLTDTLVLVADPAKDDPMLMGWDKKHEFYMTQITFLTYCDTTGGHDTPLPGSAAGFKFILLTNHSIRGFHEYTELAILPLLPTLYSHIFAVSFCI